MARASISQTVPSEEQAQAAQPAQPLALTQEDSPTGPAALSNPPADVPDEDDARAYPWHWGINE